MYGFMHSLHHAMYALDVMSHQVTPCHATHAAPRRIISDFYSYSTTPAKDYVHGTVEASMQFWALACLLCDVPLICSFHTDITQAWAYIIMSMQHVLTSGVCIDSQSYHDM